MAYSLSTHFAGQGLLDRFDFFTGKDPSHGFVDYQSREDAQTKSLVSVDEFNRVRLGVDAIHSYTTNDPGRPSVRITSKDDFTHGLFIADFAHMPGSTCGTWPAFWAFNDQNDGALWPMGGELDIIEGANTAQRNLLSAHTEPGCQSPNTGFTGVQGPVDCSISPRDIGCNFAAPTSDSASYGDVFNAEGGGVYALQWDSRDLKIWHFPRSAIPDDIAFAPVVAPDPSTWGPPQAVFGGSACDPDTYFYNMSLVINTNFCGAYAGSIWGVADECNKLAPTCEDYVARNPSSFKNAFWEINYIDVYQRRPEGNSTRIPGNSTMSTTSVASTSTPVSGNITSTPSRTRTVTVSTITHAISTKKPTQTGSAIHNPATINGYTLLGCFGSPGGYHSFSEIASFKTMDNEACVASCAGRKYAGVSGEACYCADNLGEASAVANAKCDTPCPGNSDEFCGGILSSPGGNTTMFRNETGILDAATLPKNTRVDLQRRAVPATNLLLTVYGDIDDTELPPGAPAMGHGNGTNTENGGKGGGKGDSGQPTATPMINAVTVTYTTICPTDAAHLTTLEYCTTFTGSLTAKTAMSVPMTTCTETCSACGPRGESTVTLTVPAAVATARDTEVVTAIAVETVVPVPVANYTMNSTTPSSMPVTGGGARAKRGSVASGGGWLSMLGCGVLMWFGTFVVLIAF